MTLLDRILRWNPLAGRYAFTQLRPRNLGISVGIYACMVVILAMLTQLTNAGRAEPIEKVARGLFGMLMALQVFMLWIMGLYNSGSLVREEQQDKSIDFFRLLPISPHARIVGALVGRNLVLLALGVVNGALAGMLGLLADLPILSLLEIGALIAAGAVALMLAALLSSTVEIRRRVSSGPVGLLVLCVFILPYLFGMAAMWSEIFPKGAHGRFFGYSVRLLPLITAIVLYFGAWVYAGLVRRFRHEREPLFTPRGAVGFMGGFIVLMLGLFWSVLKPDEPGAYVGLWIVTALPLLILPFASARGYEDYAEYMAAGGDGPALWPLRGNLVSGAINLGLWLVFALLARPAGAPGVLAGGVAALATFWLVLLLTIEAGIVCTPLTPRIRHLAIFLTGLYFVLPPLLAGVLDAKDLAWFSPAGYLVFLGEIIDCLGRDRPLDLSALALYAVPLVNLLLALLLIRLLRGRYRTLARGG